jgi:holo-[acyl-carrier protein] synthase
MNLSTGIDLIEIARIERTLEKYGERFLKRIYTEKEIVQARGNPPELAARFAAKEAVSKALGTGIGPVSWTEMETINLRSGKPEVRLHGRAAQIAALQGFTSWTVSLTHSRGMAAAVVVCLGE